MRSPGVEDLIETIVGRMDLDLGHRHVEVSLSTRVALLSAWREILREEIPPTRAEEE
jgi:hypothetical protein